MCVFLSSSSWFINLSMSCKRNERWARKWTANVQRNGFIMAYFLPHCSFTSVGQSVTQKLNLLLHSISVADSQQRWVSMKKGCVLISSKRIYIMPYWLDFISKIAVSAASSAWKFKVSQSSLICLMFFFSNHLSIEVKKKNKKNIPICQAIFKFL